MSDDRALTLPKFFSYYKNPVKLVSAAGGEIRAWRLCRTTGGWESADDLIDEILLAVGGEVSSLSREDFVQWVEHDRAEHVQGEGSVFALYETIGAILDVAEGQRRGLTSMEQALVVGLRRKTFVMFEEALLAAGDTAADPSLGRDVPGDGPEQRGAGHRGP
ncbi:hypothetical protein [Micromonospora endolithica]|uniref:hypothetical protein n=1 Tax=Micromonospora endolithica TaxID=230091 RepID=UPI0011ABABC9|nr:hypothetical protein [Micromonospora endolithica]TWJ23876.1 hypothetical protein JD76_04021 [Micromonospora endolithica]